MLLMKWQKWWKICFWKLSHWDFAKKFEDCFAYLFIKKSFKMACYNDSDIIFRWHHHCWIATVMRRQHKLYCCIRTSNSSNWVRKLTRKHTLPTPSDHLHKALFIVVFWLPSCASERITQQSLMSSLNTELSIIQTTEVTRHAHTLDITGAWLPPSGSECPSFIEVLH